MKHFHSFPQLMPDLSNRTVRSFLCTFRVRMYQVYEWLRKECGREIIGAPDGKRECLI